MIWPFTARPPTIERLLPGQAAEAAALHAASFATGWSTEEMLRLIREPSSEGQAAVDGRTGALVGFVLSRVAADEAEILSIAVSPKERGRGIGRGLLDTHIGALAVRGVAHLFLEVDEQNTAATRLYRGLSFEAVGKRPAYYRKPDGSFATALVMRLDLN